jgi:uracil-DNA glycosylase family 4
VSCKSCNKCELSQFANNTCIQGVGPETARVMIVGDNPNYTEDNKGEYGHGNPQKLLDQLIESVGLDPDEVYYTPAVKCRKGEKGKVSAGALKACKEYLAEELARVKPEYVITLGATALKALTNKAKITEIHGKIIDHKGGFKVLPTYHPAMSLRDPRHWDPIFNDFRRFGKVINDEEMTEHNIPVKEITSRAGLVEVLNSIRTSRVVAFDLETNGLQMRYRDSKIHQTIISTMRRNYVIQHEAFDFNQLQKWHCEVEFAMHGKVVVTANGKFDNLWLHYMFGTRWPITFDVMLASHLLDENSFNGLKQNAQTFLDMHDWDVPLYIKNGKGASGKGLTEEEKQQGLTYAAADGYATIRLYGVFKDKLSQDQDLERLFNELVMPIARAYEQMEINGVWLDLEKFQIAEAELKGRIRRIKRRLDRYINPWRESATPGKVWDGDTEVEVNWNSPGFINMVLFDWLKLESMGLTDGGAPSTAEDNLMKMLDQHDIIQALLDYRGAFKQLSSFIEGWQRRMIDGKLYPSYKVHGTVTGRPSCADPNLQQVPRDPFIRSLIGAPKGWLFFEVDYSQVELRIAAVAANEPTMLQIFRTGGDIHESTYHMVFGITPEEAVANIEDPGKKKAQLKEERKKAKAVNFGFIYGMGWKKFKEYALSKFGLNVTDAEAKAMRKRFFEIYPGLVKWHERQRRIVRSMGQVRTLTGRIRHLPQINSPDQGLAAEAERNAINAPVQGFGAEMMLMAAVEVNEFFGNNVVKLGGTIHDAMVGIVREDVAMECMARIKGIMEDPKIMRGFGIELPLPIVADVTLGNWGVGREIKDMNEFPEPINLDEYYEPIAA